MYLNNIRDVDLLERIIGYVMTNGGDIFSANSLARFLRKEHRNVRDFLLAGGWN